MLDRIARARARARAHVWKLIEDTPAGFPWLAIAGKALTGWVVTGMDATLVTAHSGKEGAQPTWKKGYGSARKMNSTTRARWRCLTGKR